MKTLCELSKKELSRHAREIINDQEKIKYICEKCARISSVKKQLCEAKKFLG